MDVENKIIFDDGKIKMTLCEISAPVSFLDTLDMYILYIKKGSGKVTINDKEFYYEGNSFFAASFTDYFLIVPDSLSDIVKIEFSFAFFKSDMGKIVAIDLFPDKIHIFKDLDIINNLYDFVCEEDEKSHNEYDLIFKKSIIEQLIICILSNMTVKNKNSEKIRNAVVYIYENFRTEITKEDVADYSDISYQAFGAFFYENMNIHFKDFLKNIRLNYSMKLAKCTNMSFTDICYESGFNSSQYFSTLFKERFGVSPKGIRNVNKVI